VSGGIHLLSDLYTYDASRPGDLPWVFLRFLAQKVARFWHANEVKLGQITPIERKDEQKKKR